MSGANKLFISGLSWGTNEASLCSAFGEYGHVLEATVVKDRDTSRSRGFGFVTFPDSNSANAALNGLNNQELEGRVIRVGFASTHSNTDGSRGGNNNQQRGASGYGGYRSGGSGGGCYTTGGY
ncbi:hypothetical protein BGZ47_008535 [Haplosporangium gracile]|nr:hypothetical protein BGZ47_008535 [Haplosporangium gracile]